MAAEYLQRMGERMAERRKDLGLTQEQAARALPGETSGTHVSRWERGLHRPSDDTLEALARVLQVDVSYFLAAPADKVNGTPDIFPPQDRLARIEAKLDRVLTLLGEDQEAGGSDEFVVPTVPQELRDVLSPQPAAQPRDADTPQKRGSSGRGA